MHRLSDTKTEKLAKVITGSHSGQLNKVLVVGCGDGIEAAILAAELKAGVTGIDLLADFDPLAKTMCLLKTGDAMNLEFESGSFDLVFSYHALEHIEDPIRALKEMRRVLREGGSFWIGTPNRSRMVGYIGGKNASLADKVRWNIADWNARLRGRFENRFGAHAGFSSNELRELLSSVFSVVYDRTLDYYLAIYTSKSAVIRKIDSIGLSNRIFPSVYFSGSK
ncbi:MAG TPA: class I SAM-dependent methyltransferase [Pyrinomonadaceae bacterium]